MSRNAFEEIRGALHFNDNTKNLERDDPKRDKLFKLRPVIDHMNQKFGSVPYQVNLAVDEQICATKFKHSLRQYNPRKPKKWGFKLFVLCDVAGYGYKFEVYSGNENFILPGERDLGHNANVVVRLTRDVPPNCHTVYFVNYYTTLPLLSALKERNILALGTIRKDRIPNDPFPAEKIVRKESRGNIEEYVTEYNDCPMSLVRWKDNNFVYITSSLCGAKPVEEIRRYIRSERKYEEIPCPQIIKVHNKHMECLPCSKPM